MALTNRRKGIMKKLSHRYTAVKQGAVQQSTAPAKSTASKIAPTNSFHLLHLEAASRLMEQPAMAELYDEIRRRAYEFYMERGGQHGSHEADWHRAESEVRSKYAA